MTRWRGGKGEQSGRALQGAPGRVTHVIRRDLLRRLDTLTHTHPPGEIMQFG